MQDKKQQLEPNMEQQTGSKLGKEYVKAVYCHPAYLTYMQSTSCEMLGWMKHKLESRLPGEIPITSDTQMTPPLLQKMKKNHQDSMVLAQKQKYRSMEQNRKPRDKSTHLWTLYLQQRRQEYTMD